MVDVRRDSETAVCVTPVSASSQTPNQGDLKMDGRRWGQSRYREGRVDQDPSGLVVSESRVMEEHQTFRETTTGQHTDDSGAGEV